MNTRIALFIMICACWTRLTAVGQGASPEIESRYVLGGSSGGPIIFDTPGSVLKIGAKASGGKMSLFGLTFTEDCTCTVLEDRTLGVDREGIDVQDSKGTTWISRKALLNGKGIIGFFPMDTGTAITKSKPLPDAPATQELLFESSDGRSFSGQILEIKKDAVRVRHSNGTEYELPFSRLNTATLARVNNAAAAGQGRASSLPSAAPNTTAGSQPGSGSGLGDLTINKVEFTVEPQEICLALDTKKFVQEFSAATPASGEVFVIISCTLKNAAGLVPTSAVQLSNATSKANLDTGRSSVRGAKVRWMPEAFAEQSVFATGREPQLNFLFTVPKDKLAQAAIQFGGKSQPIQHLLPLDSRAK